MRVQNNRKLQAKRHPFNLNPAFYAGIQIEFGKEAPHLTFETEHLLGSKPMQIDIIVKNEQNKALKKNIGRIFRKYNIIEYKGPGDYLNIDDFYKVYGYTWFYKSDTRTVDSIKLHELTLTLVSQSYPLKLIQHLRKHRGYVVKRMEPGIYRIIGDVIPIQILVTRRMTQKKNLWLRNLTDRIQSTEDAQELLKEYQKHKADKLYESAMDIIMKSNLNLFKEMENMCEALRELIKDQLAETERIAKENGKKEGEEIGKRKGEQYGEKRVNQLNEKLISLNRFDDIVKSVSDKMYQKSFLRSFTSKISVSVANILLPWQQCNWKMLLIMLAANRTTAQYPYFQFNSCLCLQLPLFS